MDVIFFQLFEPEMHFFQYQMLPSGEKEREGMSLILRNVTRMDSGVYICSAANGVDRAVQANIDLRIICKQREKERLSANGSYLTNLCLCLMQTNLKSSWTRPGSTQTSAWKSSCHASCTPNPKLR